MRVASPSLGGPPKCWGLFTPTFSGDDLSFFLPVLLVTGLAGDLQGISGGLVINHYELLCIIWALEELFEATQVFQGLGFLPLGILGCPLRAVTFLLQSPVSLSELPETLQCLCHQLLVLCVSVWFPPSVC